MGARLLHLACQGPISPCQLATGQHPACVNSSPNLVHTYTWSSHFGENCLRYVRHFWRACAFAGPRNEERPPPASRFGECATMTGQRLQRSGPERRVNFVTDWRRQTLETYLAQLQNHRCAQRVAHQTNVTDTASTAGDLIGCSVTVTITQQEVMRIPQYSRSWSSRTRTWRFPFCRMLSALRLSGAWKKTLAVRNCRNSWPQHSVVHEILQQPYVDLRFMHDDVPNDYI